jgi:hypothetical protein
MSGNIRFKQVPQKDEIDTMPSANGKAAKGKKGKKKVDLDNLKREMEMVISQFPTFLID